MTSQPLETQLFDAISGITNNVEQMSLELHQVSQEISYVRRHPSTDEKRLERIDFAHEYEWNPDNKRPSMTMSECADRSKSIAESPIMRHTHHHQIG